MELLPIMPSSGDAIAAKAMCQSLQDPASSVCGVNSTVGRERLLSELNVTTPFFPPLVPQTSCR